MLLNGCKIICLIFIVVISLTLRNWPPWWSVGKDSACNEGDLGLIPGPGRSPGEGNDNHSSNFAWEIPWTEEPRALQSMGSQRVGLDWVTELNWMCPRSWAKGWRFKCSVNNYHDIVAIFRGPLCIRNVPDSKIMKWGTRTVIIIPAYVYTSYNVERMTFQSGIECIFYLFSGSSKVKICLSMQETRVWYLGWEDPLEKEMTTTPVFLPGKSQG